MKDKIIDEILKSSQILKSAQPKDDEDEFDALEEAMDFDGIFISRLKSVIANLKSEAKKVYNQLLKEYKPEERKELLNALDGHLGELDIDDIEVSHVLLRDLIK